MLKFREDRVESISGGTGSQGTMKIEDSIPTTDDFCLSSGQPERTATSSETTVVTQEVTKRGDRKLIRARKSPSKNKVDDNTEHEVYVGKEVAYYEALVTAWVGAKQEQEKTVISISTAGVGLLVTLLLSQKLVLAVQLVCLLSLVFFVAASLFAYFGLEVNCKHLANNVANKEAEIAITNEQSKKLDKKVRATFVAGISLMVLASAVAVYYDQTRPVSSNETKNSEGTSKVSEKQKPVIETQERIEKGMSGVDNLSPARTGRTSNHNVREGGYADVQNLRPVKPTPREDGNNQGPKQPVNTATPPKKAE